MGEPLILEVTDHRGRVRQRTRLPALGLSIGRGYHNDLIIDDPYVDPNHLIIRPTDDGLALRFEDRGTLNGTWDPPRRERRSSGPVVAGLELRVGRSVVRFLTADQSVAPALFDPSGRRGIGWLLDTRLAFAALLGSLLLSGVAKYYSSTATVGAMELVTPGLAGLLVAAIWAGAWAFTNRIVGQRFRFLAHLGWTALIGTIFTVSSVAIEWLGFFSPTVDAGWLDGVVGWALGIVLLAGHFQLVTEWSRRWRWTVATLVTASVATLVAILGRPNGVTSSGGILEQVGSLKPVESRFVPSHSLDDFFARTSRLKKEVDDQVGADKDSTASR